MLCSIAFKNTSLQVVFSIGRTDLCAPSLIFFGNSALMWCTPSGLLQQSIAPHLEILSNVGRFAMVKGSMDGEDAERPLFRKEVSESNDALGSHRGIVLTMVL